MAEKDTGHNHIKMRQPMHENIKFTNLLCPEEAQLRFFKSYRKMSNHIGCYYMGYILEDTENSVRAGFTTNMDWGKEYLNKYIGNCHLWNQVQTFYEESKSSSLILPWSTVPPSTSLQKDILLRREELYIGSDGVSFCKKLGSLREYYYFAPEVKQKRFLEYVSNNIDVIKPEINIFRKDSIEVINKHSGHQEN